MMFKISLLHAGCKERKPRSVHGRTYREQKLKQHYENWRFFYFSKLNSKFKHLIMFIIGYSGGNCLKCCKQTIYN